MKKNKSALMNIFKNKEFKEMTIKNIEKKDIDKVLNYCIALINGLDKLELLVELNFDSISEFMNEEENKEEFLCDEDYINYNDFIIDILDNNIRYM